MKNITGLFCIALAVFLLGSSIKPMGEDFPRLAKIEAPIQTFGEDFPRLAHIEPTIKPLGEDFPRLA